MTDIKPQPGIMDIELYVGGKAHLDGVNNVIKLSSNENPLGPSPRAKEAVRNAASHLNFYPSSDHSELRSALAKLHNLDPDRILCANGSDELISMIPQAFAGVGDEVIFTQHAFLMYKISTLVAGATPVIVPENERTTDVDAILAAVTENTKIVFLANPNNPTGTMIDDAEVLRLIEGLPKSCLLVLDAAYAECVPGFDGGAGLVDTYENVMMTRTFSKVYGLGGMRLGWGYASANVFDILARLRGPFNVNSAALAAGLAAVEDQDHLTHCQTENAKWRDWMAAALDEIGLPSDASFGNFILVRFATEALADRADATLKENGIIIRQVKGYGLPQCLRITVGSGPDCKRVVAVLTEFQKAVNQ